MRTSQTARVYGQALVFGFLGFAIAVLQSLDVLGNRVSYATITVMVLVYIWAEVARIRRILPKRWLVNPAVICSFVFFFMGYGGTNVLFFLPSETIAFLGLIPEVSQAMVTHQYLVLIGVIALFLGYWSPLTASASQPRVVARFQRRFLPASDELKGWAIPLLIAMSVGARTVAVALGSYGYGGDSSAERIAQTSNFSQYLAMLGDLGKLALVLSALSYFAPERKKQAAFWFLLALAVEVLFGILSGFKSAIVLPFVISGLCMYLRTGRIPTWWIAVAIAAIFIAYAVVEPFRAARNERSGALTSIAEIVDVLKDGGNRTAAPQTGSETDSIALAMLSRSNLSYIGAFGIEYADAHSELKADDPAFLADIFLAPFHAWIPRFIWQSKPLANLGHWYYQVVLGNSGLTSVAMGPFTYLYFAGGYWAVGIGFFVVGMLQRIFFMWLTPWHRVAGAVVFFAMLGTVTNIDSAVNRIVISLFRELPLTLILVNLIAARPRRVVVRINASATRGSGISR